MWIKVGDSSTPSSGGFPLSWGERRQLECPVAGGWRGGGWALRFLCGLVGGFLASLVWAWGSGDRGSIEKGGTLRVGLYEQNAQREGDSMELLSGGERDARV